MYNFESKDRFAAYLRQSMSQEFLDDVKDALKGAMALFAAKKNADEN